MNFPILVDLTQADLWCIGAGAIAVEKALPMVEAGARLHIVSPTIAPELAQVAHTAIERPYQSGDITPDGRPLLVIAATDDPAANIQIEHDAAALCAWCLRVDAPGAMSLPARVPVSGITVAVSTGVPALTSKLSVVLANQLDARWGEAAVILQALRADEAIRSAMAVFPAKTRRMHWRMATTAVLDGEYDMGVLQRLLTTPSDHADCQ